MGFRLVFIVIMFNYNIGYSNIIYDKNGISITEIEITSYLNLYKNNYDKILPKNKAIKDIVLIKNTINQILIENPKFIQSLDNKIKKEFGEEIFKDEILIYFLRFQNIRNEFITDYFKNKFYIEDLEIIFSSLTDLKLPISKNKCLTIERMHSVNRDKQFILNFYENLKTNEKEFKTKIDDLFYDVCINNKLFRDLEGVIIKYIENKTEGEFNKFIYKKISWEKN